MPSYTRMNELCVFAIDLRYRQLQPLVRTYFATRTDGQGHDTSFVGTERSVEGDGLLSSLLVSLAAHTEHDLTDGISRTVVERNLASEILGRLNHKGSVGRLRKDAAFQEGSGIVGKDGVNHQCAAVGIGAPAFLLEVEPAAAVYGNRRIGTDGMVVGNGFVHLQSHINGVVADGNGRIEEHVVPTFSKVANLLRRRIGRFSDSMEDERTFLSRLGIGMVQIATHTDNLLTAQTFNGGVGSGV